MFSAKLAYFTYLLNYVDTLPRIHDPMKTSRCFVYLTSLISNTHYSVIKKLGAKLLLELSRIIVMDIAFSVMFFIDIGSFASYYKAPSVKGPDRQFLAFLY